LSEVLTNPYRYVAPIPNCFNSGTGSTYIDNDPRFTIITQIGTAGTCQWLDRETDTVSFMFKTEVTCAGNIYAYQLNAGGTMSTADSYNSAGLTPFDPFIEHTFTFPSTITLSASTAIGVTRGTNSPTPAGSGMVRVALTEVDAGGLLDCSINDAWGQGTGQYGNLNMCIDE